MCISENVETQETQNCVCYILSSKVGTLTWKTVKKRIRGKKSLSNVFHQIPLQHLWTFISMYSAVPLGTQDMFYSLVPWLALCNGQPSLPAPGPNWTSPVKTSVAAAHLHGPASTNCHWGLPNVVWSLHCISQQANTQPNHLSHAATDW